jgi:hypothetical protein
VGARKPDELKKTLFDEPIRTDLPQQLSARMSDVGVHSALAEPTAQFLSDLYVEGLTLIRLLGPAAKNLEKAPADLDQQVRRLATYLDQRVVEGVGFVERTLAFLDKRVDEDGDDTEAFEKNVARLERAGRLENAHALALALAPGSEDAATHGTWALDRIVGTLVKLVGIVELMRFERVSATTLLNGLAEINLDLNHRLKPGLLGAREEGRVGLIEMLGAKSGSE